MSKAAERKGIKATQEEIVVQEKAFKAMFPGIPSKRDDICSNEILARKYSEAISGAYISEGDIQNVYKQLQSGFADEPISPLADVKLMLEMRALLKNRSVQMKVEKCNEQLQKNNNDTLIKSSET